MKSVSEDRCDLLCLDLPKAEALRASRLDEDVVRHGAAVAKALGDPTRLTLGVALRDGGELCVCDLGWILGRSQGLVSHHLRVLREAGLVSSRREKKMVMYQLTDAGRMALGAVVPAVVEVTG
jgi:ArsR family transcriptional regulator, lead/cadmium/zinc/bismuth-responsive transcriptional repressor